MSALLTAHILRRIASWFCTGTFGEAVRGREILTHVMDISDVNVISPVAPRGHRWPRG